MRWSFIIVLIREVHRENKVMYFQQFGSFIQIVRNSKLHCYPHKLPHFNKRVYLFSSIQSEHMSKSEGLRLTEGTHSLHFEPLLQTVSIIKMTALQPNAL